MRALAVRELGRWPVCQECLPLQYRVASARRTVDGVTRLDE